MWTDASFASFAGVVASGCILAAVRNATVGMPVEETSTAPFTHGSLLFSHNGQVSVDVLLSLLAGRPDAPMPDSRCDSALLAALVWERALAGVPLADAVAEVVTTVGVKAAARQAARAAEDPERQHSTRLNVLVTDGRQLVATTWNESLWYRATPGGVLVVSEPDDDGPTVPFPRESGDDEEPARREPAAIPSGHDGGPDWGTDVWVEVPNHRLLVADTRKVTVRNLISQDGYSGFIT
jgi:glutamine amidotransferase